MRKVKILTSVVLALSGVLTVGVVQKGKAEGTVPGISFYQNPKECKELFVKAAANAAKDTQAKIAAARLEGKTPLYIANNMQDRGNMDIILSTECLRKAMVSTEEGEIGAINECYEWALTMAMTGLVRVLVVEEYIMLHGVYDGEGPAVMAEAKGVREENLGKLGEFGGLAGEEITGIAREAINNYGVIIR